MDSRGRHQGTLFLGGAALIGSIHAGFSAYWAFGGDWLLGALGAVTDRFESGSTATIGALLAVAVLKGLLAWGPLLTRRWIGFAGIAVRKAAAFGGLVLAIYGTVLTVVGLVALTGVFGEPSDPVALTGHAVLWDPLFALWGVLLLLGLAKTRRSRRVARPQDSEVGRERLALVSAR